MTAFVVETAFTASKDQVTSTLKAQAAAATTFGQKMKLAFKSAAKESSIFRANLAANLASKAITTATSLIGRGVRSVVEEYVSFDEAIGQAAAKMPEKIRRGTDAFKELEDAARAVGASTKYTATESAEALNFLAMAGFNAAQSMAALPHVTDLATSSGMDLARATDIASDALGAFNLMSSDAAVLGSNLARINDVFAKTVNTANVDMEMLYETMKDGAPAMTAAGQSVETFAALAGKMGSAGIKGSKAGMTLKNMMLQLAGPTGAAKSALKRLGIEIEDDSGNMRDIIDILGDYKRATADMGSVQRDATTDLIFGRRAISGVNILLQEGEDGLRAYRDELEAAGGTAAEVAGEIEKSLGNKLLKLKSAAIELGFKLLESFSGDGKDAIDALVETVQKFNMKSIIDGAHDVVSAMQWLYRLIRDNWNTIKTLAAGFVAFKVVIGTINFARAVSGFMSIAKAAAQAATAAGGVGAAGAGGVAGAAGNVAKPGKLDVAAGAAGGAIVAATAGYAIGNVIEDNLLNPMRESGEKFETMLNNMARKYEGVGRGAVDISTMNLAELETAAKQLSMIRRDIKEEGLPIHSVEGYFQGLAETAGSIGIAMNEALGFINPAQAKKLEEENRGILYERMESERRIAAAYAEVLQRLIALKQQAAAANSSQTQIDVNVKAPEGTTVETKQQGGNAPKVNQSKAGKN